jgi:hypothetical protein
VDNTETSAGSRGAEDEAGWGIEKGIEVGLGGRWTLGRMHAGHATIQGGAQSRRARFGERRCAVPRSAGLELSLCRLIIYRAQHRERSTAYMHDDTWSVRFLRNAARTNGTGVGGGGAVVPWQGSKSRGVPGGLRSMQDTTCISECQGRRGGFDEACSGWVLDRRSGVFISSIKGYVRDLTGIGEASC